MSYSTTIPNQIRVGNTVEFCQTAYDSIGNQLTSGAGYTLYFVMSNATSQISVSSTTENEQGYLFQIPYTVTSGWTAGNYTAVVYAQDGTNRYEQASSSISVLPSLSVAVDSRSIARQTLDALDAAILGQASSNQLSMSIAGRSISRMSLEELIKAKGRFDFIVKSEDNLQAMKAGKVSSNTIITRIV